MNILNQFKIMFNKITPIMETSTQTIAKPMKTIIYQYDSKKLKDLVLKQIQEYKNISYSVILNKFHSYIVREDKRIDTYITSDSRMHDWIIKNYTDKSLLDIFNNMSKKKKKRVNKLLLRYSFSKSPYVLVKLVKLIVDNDNSGIFTLKINQLYVQKNKLSSLRSKRKKLVKEIKKGQEAIAQLNMLKDEIKTYFKETSKK